MTIDQFTKTTSPITVLVNIANPTAVKLAKILVEQGSKLLIIDKLSSSKKKLITDLLGIDQCLFMDAESTFKNIEKFKKIDYVYYFLSQIVTGSTYPDVFAESMEVMQLTHKDFLKETNRVDAYVKLAVEFDASFTLISSAYVSQFLEPIPEANIQLQKYAESLVLDYVDRNRLNGRIVRLGELIGKEADMASPTNVARLVREVILRDKINIFGDGLQQNYLVNSEDAVYAILKAAFSKEAKGRTYMAVYPHPFTSLSIAYQLLELTVDEKQVIFNEVLPKHDDIAKLKDLCLAPSITALGWEPQITLEQSLAETMESLAQQLKQPWKQVQKTVQPTIVSESGTQEDTELMQDMKVAKAIKKNTAKVQVTGNLRTALSEVYKKVVAQPLLALLNLPKVLTTRYAKSSTQIRDVSTRVIIALAITSLLTVVALPYIHFGITGYKLYKVFTGAKAEVAAMNSTNFGKYAERIPVYVDSMAADYKMVSYLGSIPSIGAVYTEGSGIMASLQSYSRSLAVSLKAAEPVLTITKGVASISPNNPAGTVTRDYYNEITSIMAQKQAFSQAVQDAKIGQSQLASVNTKVFPRFIQAKLDKVSSILSAYTTSVDELSSVYDIIPYLLGYKDRRTYFLMVQNETELRSTGGWFSNYAIVGVENGQVRQLTVNDVYDFDGKISGLKAPADMQHGLQLPANQSKELLYKLSMSNWDPELTNTAKTVTDMLSLGGVYKPNDVTITLTFQVIRDLLQITGPIQVENLGEVTADNMYEKIGILHAQSVPGSQEKTKVVTDFLPKLMEKLVQSSTEQKEQTLSVFMQAIRQKTIMVYSANTQVQEKLLNKYDTYRTLQPMQKPLMAVDWNWGGNKANRFLKRTTDLEINEQTGHASLTMAYTNDSTTEVYPQGNYVNVQRVYYPQEFTFTSATGYSRAPLLYKTSQSLPYMMAEMQVPIQQTKLGIVNFSFRELPKKFSLYKQSGVDVEILRITITRSPNSAIDQTLLKEQEFTETNGKWVRTFVRKEDIVVRLAR